MELQWFPGHMAKTRRMIAENLKLVDVVVELVDARLPLSSRNPEIDAIVGAKPRIVVLNKADIADASANALWLKYFAELKIPAIAVDSNSGKGINRLDGEINKALAEKFEKDRKRGIRSNNVRMMVVGIPNVGKSSFINRLSGRSAAATGDRPGVTKAKQWIRIQRKYDLLDTPGILWPKFEDEAAARRIAYTGGIKDEIIDVEELCSNLLEFLRDNYRDNLAERYKLTEDISLLSGYDLLALIGKKRGCIVSGGETDTFRAANLVLDDFRSARIGKITLELP